MHTKAFFVNSSEDVLSTLKCFKKNRSKQRFACFFLDYSHSGGWKKY
jgi:hypothetical protein